MIGSLQQALAKLDDIPVVGLMVVGVTVEITELFLSDFLNCHEFLKRSLVLLVDTSPIK